MLLASSRTKAPISFNELNSVALHVSPPTGKSQNNHLSFGGLGIQACLASLLWNCQSPVSLSEPGKEVVDAASLVRLCRCLPITIDPVSPGTVVVSISRLGVDKGQ